MGVFHYLLIVLAVVLGFGGAIYLLRYLSPEPIPVMLIRALWIVCAIIVLFLTLYAFGLIGRDPKIPQVGQLKVSGNLCGMLQKVAITNSHGQRAEWVVHC